MAKDRPTVVCSAFLEYEGRYLFVYDKKFQVWRVPGGRVGSGESLKETLVREMHEELKVQIQDSRFIGWGQDIEYHHIKDYETSRLLMYFHCTLDEKPSYFDPLEIEEVRWATLEEIKKESSKEGGLTDLFERNPDLRL